MFFAFHVATALMNSSFSSSREMQEESGISELVKIRDEEELRTLFGRHERLLASYRT
jgi:hypothetical protein